MTRPAAWTPGNARTRASRSSKNAIRCAGLLYCTSRKGEMHGEDIVGGAAQVIRPQPHVALQQQAGADEQNHGERNFGAHKHFAHTGTRRPEVELRDDCCRAASRFSERLASTGMSPANRAQINTSPTTVATTTPSMPIDSTRTMSIRVMTSHRRAA